MLKELKSEDLEEAVNIFYDIYSNPPWALPWLTIEKSKQYFDDIINTPKTLAYSFFDDKRLCGACFGVVNECSAAPIYEIKEIFIERSSQNKGIGTTMLQQIEKEVRNSGIAVIKFYTIKASPAFFYYIKNGYAQKDKTVSLSKFL